MAASHLEEDLRRLNEEWGAQTRIPTMEEVNWDRALDPNSGQFYYFPNTGAITLHDLNVSQFAC